MLTYRYTQKLNMGGKCRQFPKKTKNFTLKKKAEKMSYCGERLLKMCELQEESEAEGFKESMNIDFLLVSMETMKLTKSIIPIQEKQQIGVISDLQPIFRTLVNVPFGPTSQPGFPVQPCELILTL